jgi:ATP10 protein
VQTYSHAQFPTVNGLNLQRKQLTLPQDFQGQLNLVLIAFQQWQQRQVDTWIPLARQLEEDYPVVRYYELPTIQRLNTLARTFINEGMRAGIPDLVARERTITLYLDKKGFREALQLPGEDDIHVLLLDRQGRVLWRAEGAFTPDKGESLAAAIRGGPHEKDER